MRCVTIDTNCINARQLIAAINRLEELAAVGIIEITTTRVLAEELTLDKTQFGLTRRQKAQQLRSGQSGFTIGRSAVEGPDVIGGPAIYSNLDAIAAIVAPGVSWTLIDPNTQRDITHLAIHRTHNWEFFVTLDKGILGKATALADSMGIRALTPSDALLALDE